MTIRTTAVLTLAAAAAALFFMAEPAPAGGGAPPAAKPPVVLTRIVPDGKPHKIELKDKSFQIDGEKTLLIAGEMHFGRILPEDFEMRVKQAKAFGINVISFYLFWNLVEPEEGQFDFTGMNDVRRMFKICQDNGMWVVLRPGPYCCAEVDYGGIPYWTAKYPDVKIRTNDPKYVEWSKRYLERVYKEVADLQVSKGGPMLMLQLENEYAMVAPGGQRGGLNGDFSYIHTLRNICKDAGFEVPLYVCDPGSFSDATLPDQAKRYPPDVLRGRNGLNGDSAYAAASTLAGDFPLYAPEVYTAWFSAWGQPIATKNASMNDIVNWTNYLLDHNVSWCYYVFFGGTNWGYNTGCNFWLPLMTTYDYSAPIDEAGRTTAKFRTLRNILATRTGRTLPEPPPEPAVVALPAIKFSPMGALADALGSPTKTGPRPVNMETMDQAFGFVLYRKKFDNGLKGKLELKQVMDYAVTTVNGKTIGKSFIGYGPASNVMDVNESGPVTLDILVENLGRISVITSPDTQAQARKGLVGGAFLDGKELEGWDSYSLPLTNGPGAIKPSQVTPPGPAFYRGSFDLATPASTYLNMSNWGMGNVWVNGHNLGRYWDRGGARSLFLSEHFLKPGQNEVTILELHDAPKVAEVTGTTQMVETPAIPFPVKLDTASPVAPAARGR